MSMKNIKLTNNVLAIFDKKCFRSHSKQPNRLRGLEENRKNLRVCSVYTRLNQSDGRQASDIKTEMVVAMEIHQTPTNLGQQPLAFFAG